MMHEDSLLEEKYEATVKSLLNTRVSSNIFVKASLSFLSLLVVKLLILPLIKDTTYHYG